MLRALLRLLIVLVVLIAAAAFFLGWWGKGRVHPIDRPVGAIGTGGEVSGDKAREVGAAVGEKTAEVANRAAQALSDGALTAKIKSKMALDDMVQARAIDVTTTNHIVTLRGSVRTAAEHDRAVRLAKETEGVSRVVDKLAIGG
jgi:hyperosmotically inducible protein